MGLSKEFLRGLMDNPNFKKWFGESVVRDAEGLPLEVYRGASSAGHLARDGEYAGQHGIFFSERPEGAAPYSSASEGGQVSPGYLAVEKLFDNKSGEGRELWKQFVGENGGFGPTGKTGLPDWTQFYPLKEWLDSKGKNFDGIRLDENTGVPSIAIFEPSKFKSRFNAGTFDPTDPNFLKSAGLMAAGTGAAAYAMSPDDAEAMYIGPKGLANLFGQDAAKSMLTDAEKMAAKGVGNEEIRQATGLFRGMDGKWRFEVDDAASQALRPQYPPNFMNQAAKEAGFGSYVDIPMAERNPINVRADQLKTEYVDPFSSFSAMSNHLKHDDLYRAYPDLADAPTRVDSKAKYQGVAYQDGRIEYGGGMIGGSDDRSTLLHELQHAIQQREGFAQGGDPETSSLFDTRRFEDLRRAGLDQAKQEKGLDFGGWLNWVGKNPDEYANLQAKIESDAKFKMYQDLAGEIEARDTAARMNLSPEQRMGTPPDLRDNAIVRFGGGTAASTPNGRAWAEDAGSNTPNVAQAVTPSDPFAQSPSNLAATAALISALKAKDAPLEDTYQPADLLTAFLTGGGGLMSRGIQAALDPAMSAAFDYVPRFADAINPRNIVMGLMR